MRRALRIGAWSLAGALLLAVLLVGAILVIGNTPSGRALIERETPQFTSGRVRIAGLGGAFPSAIDIARLELSDPHGVWMTAEHLSLRWSPLALFSWNLHVDSFTVGRADVVRRPVSAPSSTGTTRGRRISLPAVDIDRLVIDTLQLEPAAAGMQAVLDVHGNAHYRSLQDAQASLVARRTNGTGDYELALALARSQMSGSLRLEEPAGGPLEHLVDLPGLGALSVTASFAGPRNAQRIRLLASVGPLRASAQGTVDLDRRSADLAYSAMSPAMAPRPEFSWQRIALEGRWQGPLSAPKASSALDLQALRLPNGAQLGSLDADLEADGRLLTMRAAASGIVLPGSHPQLLAGSPLEMDASLRLDAAGRPLELTATHRLFALRAQAETAGERRATFRLQLTDLAPVAALYKQDLHGRMTLSGNVAEAGSETRLDVSGTGDLGGSSAGAELLGANARLHLAASATRQAVDVETLTLTGHALSISASGRAQLSAQGGASAVRALRARWQVSLPNLSVVSSSVAGTLDTSGTAEGSLQSLTTDMKARARITAHGSPPGEIDAVVRARGLPSAPSGTVRANGTFDGAPLRVDASIERVPGNLFHIVVERTQWKSLSVQGNLTAGSNLAAGRGALTLRMGQLADLQRFVGEGLAGSIDGRVALIPGTGHPRAHLELAAHDLAAGGISGDARLTADGPIDALRIQLSAHSAHLHGEPASLSAAARLNQPAREADLEHLEAGYRGQTVRLLSPSRVVFAGGLRVSNLRLGAQHAVLTVDGALSPALDLRASVHQVDAALVNSFVPGLLAQGTLNADAHLRGTTKAPVGRASLQLTGLKLNNAEAQQLPALDARGSARFEGSTADVSAELDAGTASRVRMTGRAPVTAAGNVDLKLSGKMDVALANSFLEARGERAAGTLTVDATVSGSARAPQIGGTVELADGDLRDYAEGIHLGDISARLVGEHGVLTLASMTARAGPGQLSAKGTVGVLQHGMPIDLQVSANRIQPITNDILTANLDADMRVKGTLEQRLDVTGTIHINRASISIPSAFPPSVAVLDVIRPGQASPTERTSRLVIGLDITMDAPEAIFVQGRGLDAQLGGRLQVTGTSENPQVTGGFSMIRGAFSLAGTQLNFTSGRVSFNGEGLKGKIVPTLDFVAQASVTYTTATTVTLHITGFADAPVLALSSMPPLPQDDLLGLLLFGKPASQLSAIQLAEIGGGLATLGGGAGGGGGLSRLNPLSWLRSTFGLNTLSVGGAAPTNATAANSNQTSGASVTAGKYISNRVYVAATQTTTGSSQVRVDVDLTQHLKLQTRLGNGTATAQGTTPDNDPGSSVGLSWQFQY